jgi:cell division septation protein DedD
MGYPRDLVRQTIERRLTTIGDDFPNVASLLEAVLEFEDHHSSVSASNATVSSLSMLVPMTAPTTAADTLHSASAPTFTSAVVAANLESTTESGQQTAAQKPKAKGKKKKKKGTANSNLSSDVERPTEEVVKLEEENRQLKEARTCRVCMDVEINTVFLPCGHLVCCDGCARSLQQCPICRTHIRGTVKTFLS